MRILVTGSSGHLGEALMRVLPDYGHQAIGVDLLASPYTTMVGSIANRSVVQRAMTGVEAVLHTATLHKPHVGSHSRQDFVDTNITGTLNLLEESVAAGVGAFVFTSTTSTFGSALIPADGQPAAWITEDVVGVPKNIYGATKTAAEDLCWLTHRDHGLPCLILRTSRFFPEDDDVADRRLAFDPLNLKVNELLYRRADIADVVDAHLLALARASQIGFGRYIISASSPLSRDDLVDVRADLPAVMRRLTPAYEAIYHQRGWRMLPSIDRIYVNDRARAQLGWHPRYTFGFVLQRLAGGHDPRSDLALAVGAKGYHARSTGVYTVR